MSLTMYAASIPALAAALKNLKGILQKGAAHAQERGIEESALTAFRLYPDMFPLSRQVQIATDMAKGCAARLAGVEPPKYPDTEVSFSQLIERVDRVQAYLQEFQPAQIDGSEERPIVIKTPRGDLHFNGQQYLQFFVLPNVYFHCATAYNILRHNGVALGKADFLGGR